MAINIEELYQATIKPLPQADRLRLLVLIAQDAAEPIATPTRSIMELEGLGAELWQGVDAQKYVDMLRDEWDHRP